MIVGIGTDIVQIERVSKAIKNELFIVKCFTTSEIEYLKNKRAESFAGIFAAKEAAVKALGTGFSKGIGLTDVEISHDENGKPQIIFHNDALKAACDINADVAHISISHDKCCAVAVCILEKK